jgi:hypothetical protein
MIVTLGAVGMLLSHTPLRVSFALLCLGQVTVYSASAQTGGNSTVSPAAPGDLSKPVFNTTTPVYGSVGSLDKAATTVVA